MISSKDDEHILNKKDPIGLTPLYQASRHGNVVMARFLVENDCNTYMVCEGESCIEVAARWNHKEVVDYFLTLDKEAMPTSHVRKAHNKAATRDMQVSIANARSISGCDCRLI